MPRCNKADCLNVQNRLNKNGLCKSCNNNVINCDKMNTSSPIHPNVVNFITPELDSPEKDIIDILKEEGTC